MHPASFPPDVPERFIRFFTHPGGRVLDPFVGSGGTLVACARAGRQGIGIELNPRYAEAARRRVAGPGAGADSQQVVCADARRLGELGLEPVDYVITSPPYWNMLRKSRGGADSTHKRRANTGLDVAYSEDERDLGNEADYEAYLEALAAVMERAVGLLRPGKYATVIAQNVRTPTGEMAPLAWDIAARLRRFLALRQETVWCQDKKRLACWGWPTTYVSNVHHHYCLHFQKAR
jgi:DNA modification methylase